MTAFLDRILNLDSVVVYLVVAALVFAEDAIFLGFVIPGETAAVLGGVTASLGHTTLVTMMVVVVAAAILGDSVGYLIGDRFGVRVLDLPPLARRRERIDSARDLLARRGGLAVFLGRFVAFLRAVIPFLAGIAHMRYAPSSPSTRPAASSGESDPCCWATSLGSRTRKSRRPLARGSRSRSRSSPSSRSSSGRSDGTGATGRPTGQTTDRAGTAWDRHLSRFLKRQLAYRDSEALTAHSEHQRLIEPIVATVSVSGAPVRLRSGPTRDHDGGVRRARPTL